MEIRLLDKHDRAAVGRFLDRLESDRGRPALGESKFVDFDGPFRGRGLVVHEGGSIVGYAHVLWHAAGGVWEMEVAAADELPDVALATLVATARSEADGDLLWWTFGAGPEQAFAARHYPTYRSLHKLSGPLPPPEPATIPPGIRIASFRVGVDEPAWLEVNNAAFAGHAENGQWTMAEITERQSRAWFSADGFRLAWLDDDLAGFCWTKVHDGGIGEIHVVGVHPAFQGRGIGRAIVVEALWYLAGIGCEVGMLYVDTTNTSALALYQSLGLGLERVDICFEVPNA